MVIVESVFHAIKIIKGKRRRSGGVYCKQGHTTPHESPAVIVTPHNNTPRDK
jgi:hypothetical protein